MSSVMPASATRYSRCRRVTWVRSQPASATMARPGSQISSPGRCPRIAFATAGTSAMLATPPPISTRSAPAVASSAASCSNGSTDSTLEPMCAPIDSSASPARRRASARSAQAIPNFASADPVARCGCVCASRPGFIRRPMRLAPRATSASSSSSDSALTRIPAARAARRSESVLPTPFMTMRSGGQPARTASASSTSLTTSAPAPSATSRRRSCGSELAFTA